MYVRDVLGLYKGAQDLHDRPTVISDVLEDLATEIGFKMASRDYNLADFERLVGCGETRRN